LHEGDGGSWLIGSVCIERMKRQVVGDLRQIAARARSSRWPAWPCLAKRNGVAAVWKWPWLRVINVTPLRAENRRRHLLAVALAQERLGVEGIDVRRNRRPMKRKMTFFAVRRVVPHVWWWPWGRPRLRPSFSQRSDGRHAKASAGARQEMAAREQVLFDRCFSITSRYLPHWLSFTSTDASLPRYSSEPLPRKQREPRTVILQVASRTPGTPA